MQKMVQRFREVDDKLQARPGRGATTREVVTLASLVEKETAAPKSGPASPRCTRIGCASDAAPDRSDGDLRAAAGRSLGRQPPRENLESTRPTTRTVPRPAARPHRLARPRPLEAALRPAAVPYLYFVSRNDGSHVFAATLAEHNRNVRQFQVQYFRDQRRAGRK